MARAGARTRAPLGRNFQLLFAASAVSMLGDGVGLTALPLLAARLSADPLPVALVAAAGRLPWLLFGLVAGAIADRHDRRRLMWRTDALRALLAGGLAIGVLTGAIGIWALAAFAFVLATAGVLFDSAAQALIPAVVADGEPLQRANGRLAGAQMAGEQMAGPAVGGVLFAAAAAVPFALDALSFAGSAALLGRVRGQFRPHDPAAGTRSLRRDIVEGVRWLAGHRLLRSLALLGSVVNAALAAQEAVLVVLATGRLHLSATGYGLLIAGSAAGGISASLTATGVATRIGTAATIRYGIPLIALGSLGTGLAPTGWFCGLCFGVTVYAAVLLNVAIAPLRQTLMPDALRSRVFSAMRVLAFGAMPLGAVLGGAIAAWLGIRAPFVLAAALVAGCAAVAWRTISAQTIQRAREGVT
jgi:MFS family permease